MVSRGRQRSRHHAERGSVIWNLRFEYYSEVTTDEIARLLADNHPITGDDGREGRQFYALMQREVMDEMNSDPEMSYEEAIDFATQKVMARTYTDDIDDEDYMLRWIVSP